ncbi:MAG: hypothetical protein WDZ73_00290 [Candidatus Paceibacterota bacterium]
MKKNKKLYLVPGFGESPSDYGYMQITKIAESYGYCVVPVSIRWSKRTATHWVKDFLDVVEKNGAHNSIALGFSFGAYVVALASMSKKFDEIILCSMSPYFKEDLKFIPHDSLDFFGKRRVEDFKLHLTPIFNTKTSLYFGDQDWLIAIKKAEKLAKSSKLVNFFLIKGVGHDISHNLYIKTIAKKLKPPRF